VTISLARLVTNSFSRRIFYIQSVRCRRKTSFVNTRSINTPSIVSSKVKCKFVRMYATVDLVGNIGSGNNAWSESSPGPFTPGRVPGMIYDIFVNCNWVVTRWQQYSAHLHTNNTQNDTKQTIHRTTQQFWRVWAVPCLG